MDSLFWGLCISGKGSACQCRRCKKHGFNPWVGKIPWRRAWQPTPVFLPGNFHGKRSLEGYNPWCCKELETDDTHFRPIVIDTMASFSVLSLFIECNVRESKLHLEYLNITHYQRNANQNHNEVPSHAGQSGCYPEIYRQ